MYAPKHILRPMRFRLELPAKRGRDSSLRRRVLPLPALLPAALAADESPARMDRSFAPEGDRARSREHRSRWACSLWENKVCQKEYPTVETSSQNSYRLPPAALSDASDGKRGLPAHIATGQTSS